MIKFQQRRKQIQISKIKPNLIIKSLIDQNNTTPQQINSITPPNHTLSKNIKLQLEEEINHMLDQIMNIINQNNANLRQVMNYVRSSILFKDIDQINDNVVNQIVGEFTKNKIENLQHALQLKSKQIQNLKKQMMEQINFNQNNLKINKFNKFDIPRQNHPDFLLNIYTLAKESTYIEFQELYKQYSMRSRLEKVQINSPINSNRKQSKFIDFKQQKKAKLMRGLGPLLNNLSQQQRSDLLQILRQQLTQQCSNPCCRWSQIHKQNTNKLQFTNIRRKQTKSNSFYMSDKIDKYYKRYYHNTFQIDKIKNKIKTQSQQIQKLYRFQKSKPKIMKKVKNFRSQSTV